MWIDHAADALTATTEDVCGAAGLDAAVWLVDARLVFERLARRPSSVGQLADALPVSPPAVSQHLKVLKEAGLVVDSPDGTRRVYRIDPRGIEAMRDYLDQFGDRALAAYNRDG